MEKANRIEVALLYCAVLYEVMPHTYLILIMHKQAMLKVILTGMHAILLSRCIHCQCKLCKDVATILFLLKWCTSGSNTNIAVDFCAVPDNISEIVQKVVE